MVTISNLLGQHFWSSLRLTISIWMKGLSATVIIIFVVVQPRHLQFVVALNVLFIAQATGDLPSSGLSPSSSLFLGQVGGGQYCLLSICEYCLSWTNTTSEQKIPKTILTLKRGPCLVGGRREKHFHHKALSWLCGNCNPGDCPQCTTKCSRSSLVELSRDVR